MGKFRARVSGQRRSGRGRRRDMQLLVKCINLIIEKEKKKNGDFSAASVKGTEQQHWNGKDQVEEKG